MLLGEAWSHAQSPVLTVSAAVLRRACGCATGCMLMDSHALAPMQQSAAAATAPAPASQPTHLMIPQSAPQGMSAARASANAAAQGPAVRCLCNSTAVHGQLLQCQGPGCTTWQHADCLSRMCLLPPGKRPHEQFMCELCRLRWADPFWDVLIPDILPPTMLHKTGQLVQVRIACSSGYSSFTIV